MCPVQRPSSEIQQDYYSGKHKYHAMKYEVGIHPISGRLVWIGGPVPGSVHDMRLMYLANILKGILPQELILGDKGYIGNWNIVTPFKKPETVEKEEISEFLSSKRWIVEHVLGRFKNFKCLSTQWRHNLELHGYIFYIIAEIVNVDMIFCPVRR